MRTAIYALLAFLAAAIVFWFLTMVVYVVGSELQWWRDRDGGVAMGFAFTIGPFFALIGGGIAAVVVVVRRRRRRE